MSGSTQNAAPTQGTAAGSSNRLGADAAPDGFQLLTVPPLHIESPRRAEPAQGAALARRTAVLKALSNPTRLEITEALQAGELCVNQLRDLVGMDVSTVSKHLSILRAAGVLNSEKRGLNVYYGLACECFGEFLRCVDGVCAGNGIAGVRRTACC